MTGSLPTRDRRPRSARWWAVVAAAMAVGALGAYGLADRDTALWVDWQPTRAVSEPWRAWTAVFVHYSKLHLAANLAGSLAVAAWGLAARVPARSVAAWLIAWPLVQWGLLLQPELQHYGGLSGVLHAGVAVVAVHLMFDGPRTQRRIGAAVLAALVVKLLSESPWRGAVSHPSGWDIAVAPGAHVCGVLAGSIVAALAEAGHRIGGALREALGIVDAHE